LSNDHSNDLDVRLARSILRTYIDEGRVSAKQRAGTRLRFITEEEAEMIRDMKRRHPLITIGQIQMRLQRTANRVLSKASISRILTNSIRLGKRAKRSFDGEDEQDGQQDHLAADHDELMQLSSDENTGGAIFVDDTNDDDEDDEAAMDNPSSLQNLDDFQRFMLRKTSINGDDASMVNDGSEQYDENGYSASYPQYGSEEDEDDVSIGLFNAHLERFLFSCLTKMKRPLLSIFDLKSHLHRRWPTVGTIFLTNRIILSRLNRLDTNFE
jgi:hypothetical protein